MSKWYVGDIAAIQRPHEPTAGIVIIESIAELPENESDKYFGVRAVSVLVDWSAPHDALIARKPGEIWNAHFAELHDVI